jgi:ribonuclease J
MNFTIHRGTHEIGGSCVEIWTQQTRIIVDFGMPLVNSDNSQFDSKTIARFSTQELINNRTLPNIQSLYQSDTKTALILSHAHQDHYGLINYLHKDCHVYLGKATQRLIEITNIFSNKTWKISNPHHFESGKPFVIGDIEIIPYLMDHSAFDAYAFMIKANGKSLFYSGDFRIHGRKANAFYWFSHNVDQNADYLLMEGTTLGRSNKKFPTEDELEIDLIDSFKTTQGINLIYTSGQNIDRLVSIYKACKRQRKILAIDFYIANILKDLADLGAKIPYPSSNYPEIKVFFPFRLSRMMSNQGNEQFMYRFKNFKITKEEIDNQFENTVMVIRPSMLGDLECLQNLKNGMLIYSMWSGYKKDESTKEFIDTLKNKGMGFTEIHTSGHADLDGLKKMVEVLKPKNLVPIHTFDGDQFDSVFLNVNVVRASDNETILI